MDRGNKMWEGHRFMVPSYKEALLNEKPAPRKRPVLDEQYLSELDRALEEAIDTGFRVRVTVWGPYVDRVCEGCIIGAAAGRIHMETLRGLVKVPVRDVVGIESPGDR